MREHFILSALCLFAFSSCKKDPAAASIPVPSNSEPSQADIDAWIARSTVPNVKVDRTTHMCVIDQATKEGRVSLKAEVSTTAPLYRNLTFEEATSLLNAFGVNGDDLRNYAQELVLPPLYTVESQSGRKAVENFELRAKLTVDGWALSSGSVGSSLPSQWTPPPSSIPSNSPEIKKFTDSILARKATAEAKHKAIVTRAQAAVDFLKKSPRFKENSENDKVSFTIKNVKTGPSEHDAASIAISGEVEALSGTVTGFGESSNINEAYFYGYCAPDAENEGKPICILDLEWGSPSRSGSNKFIFDGKKMVSYYDFGGKNKFEFSAQ